jgi:photosystem II stability/assembly factor-like uncharacterized protein
MYVAQAGTINGDTLLKSTDQGETWIHLPIAGPQRVTCAENNPNLLFAQSMVVFPRPDILKSTDGGNSWSVVFTAPQFTFPSRIAISPHSSSVAYAGFSTGEGAHSLYFSLNGGQTWDNATRFGFPPGVYVSDIVFDPSDPQYIYASVAYGLPDQVGVWRTVDGGLNWNRVVNGLTNPYVYSLAINLQSSSTLYAGVPEGIFRSTDRGEHWTATGFSQATLFVSALQVDPITPQVIYAGTYSSDANEKIGVYKSTDGGASWSLMNSGLVDNWVQAMKLDPQNHTTLFVGTPAAFYRSTNAGVTWVEKTRGIHTVAVSSITAINGVLNTNNAGAGGGVFHNSSDGGVNWVTMRGYDGNAASYPGQTMVSQRKNPSRIFATRSFRKFFFWHTFYRSFNCGVTWEWLPGYLYGGMAGFLYLDPNETSAIYDLNSERLQRSTDLGDTWIQLYGTTHPYCMAVDQSSGTEGHLSQTLYLSVAPQTLLRSTDAGSSWSQLDFPSVTATALIVDPTDNAILFAGTEENGILKSTDEGSSWFNLSDPSVPMRIAELVIDERTPANLYCLSRDEFSNTSVHCTQDGGATWSNISPASASGQIRHLVLDYIYDVPALFAAANGVYRYIPSSWQGTITQNTTWSGQVFVVGNLAVASGVTLTVQPNTTVKFFGGTQLTIDGSLLVNGTSQNPVTMTSINTGSTWSGIITDGALHPTVSLSYANITGASTALYVGNSTSLTVDHCTFTHCDIAIQVFPADAVPPSQMNITHNTFSDFPPYCTGIAIDQHSDLLIANNTLTGPVIKGTGIYLNASSPRIIDNTIQSFKNGLTCVSGSAAILEGVEGAGKNIITDNITAVTCDMSHAILGSDYGGNSICMNTSVDVYVDGGSIVSAMNNSWASNNCDEENPPAPSLLWMGKSNMCHARQAAAEHVQYPEAKQAKNLAIR